ncbi:MAG: L-arabinose transport system permease protein AraQ [Chloroflexi bacterium]|nr:L-arabinose transport system permease protein AraQ [Chloroflexota bacterium]
MNPTRPFRRALIYGILIFFVIIFLVPAYMVVATSLKDPIQISLKTAWDLPNPVFFQGFVDAWIKFKPNIINSLSLVIPATLISAMMGSINGYVLAKWKFPGSNVLFMLMLFGMFIPYQSILIPLFRFLKTIGLYGNISGLVIVHVIYGLPITTLIFRNYYAEIPTEMIEAGKIDGAGFFKIYGRIVFPISLPGFVVVIIWQFTQVWNEFLFAVTLTSGTGNEPITVALSNLAGGRAVQWNLPMAGSLMAALPTLLVYLFLGRYFIRGLLAGSVKG